MTEHKVVIVQYLQGGWGPPELVLNLLQVSVQPPGCVVPFWRAVGFVVNSTPSETTIAE